MSRRDTIIVAVLINTGLLAVLFMMAMHTELPLAVIQEQSIVELAPPEPPLEIKEVPPARRPTQIASRDELDDVLRNYSMVHSEPVIVTPGEIRQVQEPTTEEKYVEVTVKRGDFLERIARTNGTTVGAILRANNMMNARIDVGQVLKVPVGRKNETVASTPKPQPRPASQPVSQTDKEYYTLKSGDNPWKVAKQYRVKFDDLLKLNDLDEAKARSLKPGDVLRVK